MRRSEAKTLQTLDFVDGIKQLHKWTLIADLRKTRDGRRGLRFDRARSLLLRRVENKARGTSARICSIVRLRSAPARLGARCKNVQCMLHPCMIETNAGRLFSAPVVDGEWWIARARFLIDVDD